MDVGQADTEDIWPDLDAVSHVNQFGSPDTPVMDIACVPEKFDTVRDFLIDNSVEL